MKFQIQKRNVMYQLFNKFYENDCMKKIDVIYIKN